MVNTYTQVHVQFVFSVKHRENCIPAEHREEIHKYISAITQDAGHKMLAIFCMPDHIHILIGLRGEEGYGEYVRKIKTESTKFINGKKWMAGKFQWQSGYGAFSYSRSHVDRVIHYIRNQEEHHRKKSFREEYIEFLEKFEVEYDERYLFDLEWGW